MPALANTFLFAEPWSDYLEYSSKVLHDLIATNKTSGQNIVELINADATVAKVKEQLASLNPMVFGMCGHGNECYDEETEILTENGWKSFSILSDEKVATLDEGGNLVYAHPTTKYSFQYHGEMLHVDGKRVDLLVTPNHRMYVAKGKRYGRKWGWSNFFITEAQNMPLGNYKFKQTAKWNCTYLQSFIIPAVTNYRGSSPEYKAPVDVVIEDWLRFFGIWLAEGCTSIGKRSSYRITITQMDDTKRELMKQWVKPIANALGCAFMTYESNNHSKAIVLKNKQLCMYLRQFGKAKNKFIPWELKQLPPEQLSLLLDGMILGDGQRKGDWACVDTASKRLADDIQEICLKIGKVATVSIYEGQELWRVSILNRDAVVQRKSRHWESYSGKIYCVTVPNGLVYVRRHGKPCWCGNSTTTLQNQEIFMQVGGLTEPNIALMRGRVVHLNSCVTGVTLGPAIMNAGALAYVGSNESFWFYVGDAPNSTRAVQSPFLAEWAFDVALLQGKTVGDARADQLARYDSELAYWVEGAGNSHPDASELARMLNINKAVSTFAGVVGTIPSPVGGAVAGVMALPPEVLVPLTFLSSGIALYYILK